MIFEDEAVTITTARAMLGGTTYAMANITSVRLVTEAASYGPAVVVGGIFIAIGAFGDWAFDALGFAVVCVLIGLGIGALLWKQAKAVYWINVGTAGAEQRALSSTDEGWAKTVVAALNDAIVQRG